MLEASRHAPLAFGNDLDERKGLVRKKNDSTLIRPKRRGFAAQWPCHSSCLSLPAQAIFFVFSRKGCEAEADACGDVQLLALDEEAEARRRIRAWAMENEEVARLDSERGRIGLLTRGVAAHHAGLLPQYKALVEDLFKVGLVKACFATETLAAGVNLPARTTVITSLVKRGDSPGVRRESRVARSPFF